MTNKRYRRLGRIFLLSVLGIVVLFFITTFVFYILKLVSQGPATATTATGPSILDVVKNLINYILWLLTLVRGIPALPLGIIFLIKGYKKTERLRFTNNKGEVLSAILHNPTPGDTDTPIVIACHGTPDTHKGRTTYTTLQQDLAAQGIAIFRFDFSGHGESEGKFEDMNFSKAVSEAQTAYNFVKKLGYKHIALFGSSFGGCAVLKLAAELGTDIFALVCKCPVSNYQEKAEEELGEKGIKQREKENIKCSERKGQKYYRPFSFYTDAADNDVYKVAKDITVPTLIVHGDQDSSVPISQSKKTAKLIPNCQLEIIKGARHDFNNPGEKEKIHKLFADFFINNK